MAGEDHVKLYVDDIRECPDRSWTLCQSNLEAVKALDTHGQAVTDISLDHDISHALADSQDRTCACAETFEVAARYIALMKRQRPGWTPKVTIHTSNPHGAEAMKAILKAVGLHPSVDLKPPAKRE